MRDGRSRAAGERRNGNEGERAKRSPQARTLGAIKPREAARLARIESLSGRRSAPWASPLLLGAALISCCATALLLLPARGGATMPEEPKIVARETAPAARETLSFVPIARPARLFALDFAELAKAGESYDALRSAVGDGREDRLQFGAAAHVHEPFMQIAVYRTGIEAVDPAPFFVDVSRRAAAAGLAVSKATPGEPMPSKFGEMENAEVKLSMDGVERSCVAFRRAVPGEALRLSGWYCPPAGELAPRAGLSCLVDRLELSAASEDKVLRDGFAAARARGTDCGKPPAPVLAASVPAPPQFLKANAPRPRGTKARRKRIP